MKKSLCAILLLVLCASGNLIAQHRSPSDKSGSPYFLLDSEFGGQEHFPLVSTKVRANIVGPVADVVVEQVYRNDGKDPIEAVYVFPASTRAAVYDLVMKIGDRKIQAEIKKKEEARRDYEVAKGEGKKATLLEQERGNVFSMHVANIMPGDVIEVYLRYNEFIIPEDQVYTFVYPTVVGPRYGNDEVVHRLESFAANPYLREGVRSPSIFDIAIAVDLSLPVESASCSSHKMDFQFEDAKRVQATLSREDIYGGNRDFIFNYEVSGKEIGSGTILYEHADEKFFLTTIEPPKIQMGAPVLPREYVFVVDVSGSMSGFPIETTKKLLKDLIGRISPDDFFNMLLFAGDDLLLAEESLPATAQNLEFALAMVEKLEGRGGTELLPALERILKMPKHCEELSRSILVVTDGYIMVEPEVFELISNNLNEANLFAFGIGSSVNRLLIEGMAHIGRGEPFIVEDPASASQQADRFRKYIEHPLMTDITVHFDQFDAYDIVPAVIPDLMAERPIYVFGKYRGEPQGQVRVMGNGVKQKIELKVPVTPGDLNADHGAIRYLWAREKIRWQHDFCQLSSDQNRIDTITELGLQYNLLTDYTSFIAIDESTVVNQDGVLVQRRQALPLPAGVSNYAIGFDLEVEGSSTAIPQVKKKEIEISVLLGGRESEDLKVLVMNNTSFWNMDLKTHFSGKSLSIDFTHGIENPTMLLDGNALDASERRVIGMLLKQIKSNLTVGLPIKILFGSI